MNIEMTERHVPELGKIYFASNHDQPDDYVNDIKSNFCLYPTIEYILNACRRGLFSSSKKFIDIGANIGAFTLPVAKSGVKTLAIEALPDNFTLLSEAIKQNKLHNVVAVHAAASDCPGVVNMNGTSAWASIDHSGNGITVPALTIDTLAETYGFMDADIIKMDVEGAEMAVCAGMKKLFSHQKNVEIIFEANVFTCGGFGYSVKKLKKFFEDLGYQLYAFNGNILSPSTSDSCQHVIVQDYLATKNDLSKQKKFAIRQPTFEESIASMLQDIKYSIYHQAHFFSNMTMLSADLREDAQLQSVAQRLSCLDTAEWHAALEIVQRGL